MKRTTRILILAGMVVLLLLFAAAWVILRPARLTLPRLTRLREFFNSEGEHPDWRIQAGDQCENAPFQFPTSGYVGFYWGDSFRPPLRHTGLDIFGGTEPGTTRVFAAYSGYLTRLPDWKSTVIIRIPSDPLNPGRQIWTYYTHMADLEGNSFIDEAFPTGTAEKWVEVGTLLGKMGNYSGSPGNPTGVHLHFSIVLDDGAGKFRDERVLNNTLDPSPYFGRSFDYTHDPGAIAPCR